MRRLHWKRSGLTLAFVALVIAASAALSLGNPPQDAAAQTALPELKIAATTATVAEGGELLFTISASEPTLDRDLTVNLQVTEDTSQSRTYLAASERGSKRAVLYAGMETGTYQVKTVDDNNDEHDGAVTVTLRPGNGYTVGATNAATGTVTDTEGTTVALSIDKTAIAENGGKTDITYILARGLKAGQTVAFKAGTDPSRSHGAVNTDWTLQLKPGADNRGVTLSSSGTVNGVAATAQNPIVTMSGVGVQVATLELTAVDDTATSNREINWFIGRGSIFVQTLGSATGIFRVGGARTIYLVDDENTDPVEISFTGTATFSGSEKGGLIQPVISFSRAATPGFTMPLIFTDGTATEGEDYREIPPEHRTVKVSAGPNWTFDIPLIDDLHKEGDETFTVAIDMDALPDLNGDSEGNGWVAGTHATATITINNDDGDVHASIRAVDGTATEGSSSDKATFRVSLDSVRGAAGPLTDGDSARINFAFLGGAHGKDFDVNLLTNHPTLSSDGASVKFNPNAVSPAQDTPLFADFELIAREDNDAVNDVVRIKLAVVVAGSGLSTGTSSGEAVITLRDNDREATGLRMRGGLDGPIADNRGVFIIGEGSNATFVFGLTEAPTAIVNADASISSGGYAASITSGTNNQINKHDNCYSRCNWRVEFRYNYNSPQISTLNGQRVVIAATEDIATVPTDDVTLRIALRSDDKNYDGAVYEYPIKVINNDQDISVGLVSTSAVNLPESHNGRIRLGVRASHPVHAELTPQLTWPDPSDSGHFNAEQDIDIVVEPIPVGGTMGYIYLDAKDDNIAEAQATATATLSLDSPPAGVTVNENRNTFLLRHGDDDRLNIRLIERRDWKGTPNDTSDDTFSHALYFTRPVDYSIEVFLKGKDSADDRTLGMPSTVTQDPPNLTRPHEYTLHGGLDQYSAIVARTLGEDYTFFERQAIVVSDGIQLIDHDDPLPVSGPPLRAQSSEVSPQGEVHDALTMGVGNGGGSLNDRVNGISVSGVTAEGFTLAWSAADGADSYRVRYWQDENAVSVFPVSGTTYTATGLDPETEYSVQIMAVVNGNVDTSKSSPVITVTTAAAAATPVPTPTPAATPTPTSAPARAAAAPDNNCVADSLLATVRYYYDVNQNRPPGYGENWKRVLIAFGDVQDGQLTPYTAAEAQQGEQRWSGWAPIRQALECIESATQPAPTPTPTPALAPTPTPTPTPAPTPTQSVASANNCVADSLLATVRYYYDANQNRPPGYGENWKRVLIAFGDVQDGQLTPYTAAEAQQSEQRWRGWRPVRQALECIESAT